MPERTSTNKLYLDLLESEYAREKLKYEQGKRVREEALQFRQNLDKYIQETSRKVFGENAYKVFGKEESVNQEFKKGDRVRVTYDTVITKPQDWATNHVEVISAIQTQVNSEGGKWETVQPTSLIPLGNLTKLGPESDPTGATRVRSGKDFVVAVKRDNLVAFEPFPWSVVAAWSAQLRGQLLSNDAVKDWDVLGQ